MDYAIINFQGHQYQIKPGQELIVDHLGEEKGKEVKINDVLLIKNDDKVTIGQPNVDDVLIKAKVLENFKGEKIRVARFKAKNKYRRVKGFRPQLTKIKIGKFGNKGKDNG